MGTNDSGQNQAKYLLNGHVAELILFNDQIDDGFNQVQAYLAKKWGLTATVDSDGDGFTDAIEAMEGTSILDASSNPLPDLSDAVDAQIGEASGLDAVEGNVALWLDASNINGLNNSGMANSDAIAEWKDLSEMGIMRDNPHRGIDFLYEIKIPFDLMEVMIVLHCPTFCPQKRQKATGFVVVKDSKTGSGRNYRGFRIWKLWNSEWALRWFSAASGDNFYNEWPPINSSGCPKINGQNQVYTMQNDGQTYKAYIDGLAQKQGNSGGFNVEATP